MNNYKPNSNISKQNDIPDKKISKITTGNVKVKKKGEVRKFADMLISEDASSVKSYIVLDVLIPALKNAIEDIVHFVLRGGASARKSSNASKVSYAKYFDKNRSELRDDPRADPGTLRPSSVYSYDDIIIDNRGEAEEILIRMDELIATYGIVSVADFYDLVGVTGDYTDNKYGWTSMANAEIIRVRDGYRIKLPRALSIN